MADHGRQSQFGLSQPSPPPEAVDFFELLRRLEGDGLVFGRSGRPDREPARLGQEVRLGFATRDVARFVAADGNAPARVTITLVGLLGPEGPMPLHLTRWVLDRLSQRWFAAGLEGVTADTTFRDFTDLVQHRLIGLYYRAWADQHPAVQVERDGGGRVHALWTALSGAANALGPIKLSQAPALAHQVFGPERLTGLLTAVLGVPVRAEEFVATWSAIPRRLQTRLSAAHAALGRGATLGPRHFGRQSRIELRIGPLGLTDYRAFLPDGRGLATLRRTLLHAIGETLDVDFRPVLRRSEIPAARLGEARLGRIAWLCPDRADDAADLRLRAVVGLPAEPSREAA
jgi:type VI secretion system protein ImpH